MCNETLLKTLLTFDEVSVFDRIDFFSKQFLGASYLTGAQSEDRLYRFDGFDCVTYVSTVLALAISKDPDDFERNILGINYYDAKPCFENRFHFMSCDWNVQNQKNGIVKDITQLILDDCKNALAIEAVGEIDKPSWYRRQNKLVPSSAQVIKARILYLPLTSLFDKAQKPIEAIFSQIPQAAIIEIVRPNWDLRDKIGTRLHVSHLGFVFWKNRQLLFRHASSKQGGVVEVLLTDYLSACIDSPTIKGINVQAVQS